MLVNCTNCDKEFNKHNSQILKTKNNFCSSSCSATYNNKKRVNKSCENCGGILNRSDRKYCGKECANEHRYLKRIEVALDNKSFSGRLAKKYLLKTSSSCSVCNRKTWNGEPIPLEVDHKDGNSENRDIRNIRLICPNCHSQTPTYKGRNKGNGRHFRRVRYKEGKSY